MLFLEESGEGWIVDLDGACQIPSLDVCRPNIQHQTAHPGDVNPPHRVLRLESLPSVRLMHVGETFVLEDCFSKRRTRHEGCERRKPSCRVGSTREDAALLDADRGDVRRAHPARKHTQEYV